ncbi:MAG: hypothetical protein ACTSXT_17105 [Candidatus Helarchaeota archaeon]
MIISSFINITNVQLQGKLVTIEVNNKKWDAGGVPLWNYFINAKNIDFKDIDKMLDLGNDAVAEIVVGGMNISSNKGIILVLNGLTGAVVRMKHVPHKVSQIIAVQDYTGDSQQEIVFFDNNYDVHCLNGINGSYIWNFKGTAIIYYISEGDDANNGGYRDILVEFGSLHKLFCLNGLSGIEIWNSTFTDQVVKVKKFQDVNSDGISEVMVG